MRAAVVLLLMAALGAVGESAIAQEVRIMPADEGAGDASWRRFKTRLLTAIEKRDKQFLISILEPDVRNQTDGARGVAEFRKQWELDAPDTPLWRELGSTLQLGAAFVKREKGVELCAPYLLGKWPPDVDPFDYGAIVARETMVQAEPSTAAAVLGTLSYHVTRVVDWEVADKAADAKQKWVRIQFREGEGYVPEEHVRSPIEQVACFVKTPAGWKMSAFAPAGGD